MRKCCFSSSLPEWPGFLAFHHGGRCCDDNVRTCTHERLAHPHTTQYMCMRVLWCVWVGKSLVCICVHMYHTNCTPTHHSSSPAGPIGKRSSFFNELVNGPKQQQVRLKNSTFRPPAGGEKVEFLFNELVGRFPRENHHFPTSSLKNLTFPQVR